MPRSSPATVIACLLLPLALFAAGCQQGDRPELGEVQGVVTLDGSPLAGAILYFSPEGGGRPSQASTDTDGKYELVYIGTTKGAKAGKHKVRITTAYEGIDPTNPGKTVHHSEQVPAKYNQDTELIVDVLPEVNTHNFELKGRVAPKKKPERNLL